MPEYPDITVYIERLNHFLKGEILLQSRIVHPFVLRTFDPPINEIQNKEVIGFRRMGKRIVFVFSDELFMLCHLMVAGRLQWKKKGAIVPGRIGLAAFDFSNGTLVFTEAGTKKRASIHLVRGEDNLERFDQGGVEIFQATFDQFRTRLIAVNHTLKRALTDPWLFSGIGNAYSDEILHRAKLSPLQLSQKMSNHQIEQLFKATKQVLGEWTDRLRNEVGNGFPEKVTAFHKEMAVHGKYGEPCPVCGTKVQRIRYAENETNYCPTCQTGGKLYADRGISRLLKNDWPKTLEELENRFRGDES